MPQKKCICSICQEEVLKGSTYALTADGSKRACKIHEGVIAKAEERKELKHKSIIAELKQREYNKTHPREHPLYGNGEFKGFVPKCWRCGSEGIYERDFWMKHLLEMEKYDIMKGSIQNIFDLNHPANNMKELCIYRLPKSVLDDPKKKDKMPSYSNPLVDISGLVCLCVRCMDLMKIVPPGIENITIEKLMTAGALYDVILKPVLQEQAKVELARDN